MEVASYMSTQLPIYHHSEGSYQYIDTLEVATNITTVGVATNISTHWN